MKWIGQQIYDLISRFRNDDYLEEVSTGTIASGGNLGLDSNNKIVKATIASGSGDITGVTIQTDSGSGSKATDTAGSADFSILGASGVGVTNSGTTITAVAVPAEIDHDSLNNFAANEHFTQANITTVGTIDTGVWNGTAIASAYLDSDTAHLSGTQTFTGTKTLNSFKGTGATTVTNILDEDAMGSNSNTALATQQSIKAYADTKVSSDSTRQTTFHTFTDDMALTKQYIGLNEADAENTNTANKFLPFPAITAGKLIKVALRSNKNLTGHQITFRLEKIGAANPNSATPDILGAQTGAGSNTTTMTTYDFTTGLDSGDGGETNAFSASDLVFLSIQSDTDFGNNVLYYITCIWEFDLS